VPTTSKKQERFMQAVSHNPKFAKQVGVPQKVGKEFTKSEGGQMKDSKKMVKKEIDFMKKKGAPKSMIKHEKSEMMACGGKPKKMAYGGGVETQGKTKGAIIKMASGGSVSKRADGVAQRGKTNCKVV